MQNMGNAQLTAFAPHRGIRMRAALLACLVLLAAFAIGAVAPQTAQAKSYTMPQVDIDAEVLPNGDLHVVEQRHFSFDGAFTCVYWNFEASNVDKKDQHGYTVNSVKIAQYAAGQESSATTETLDPVTFRAAWRDSGGPGTDAWSYDSAQTSLYVFFNAEDQDMTVTIDYTVKEAAIAYQDVGEVYWKYVGSGWAEDSQNVTCTIHTPVPVGTTVEAGSNLRAWGHGPLDGTVDIASSGTVVYKAKTVYSGHYAEARVVFPVEWLTSLSETAKEAHGDELGLDTIVQEESNWADSANAQRVTALAFLVFFFALSLILLVATIIVFMRHGRELKPEFQEKYWREAPDKKLHPAVVGRCWRFDKESTEDLTATLVHLSAIGAVAINKGTYEQKKHFGRVKEVEGLYLTRVPAVADTLTDPLDRKALELVFDTVGQGEDSLWMSSFTQFAADHPQEFKDAVDAWQGELTARTMRAELFEPKGPRRRTITTVAAVVYAIFGVVLSGMTMQVVPVLVTLPVAAVMLVLARFMERRTRAGAELNARSTALRNWLRDFTRTDEQPPTGVKVWGELLVYAYLFGVADEVIKQLKDVMPELFQEDAMVAGGYTYMPFFWFTDTGAGMGGGIGSMPSASDLFSTAVANSVSTIDAASSSFSDGFGGGGGFSMGGGGGFGGGGGAR